MTTISQSRGGKKECPGKYLPVVPMMDADG